MSKGFMQQLPSTFLVTGTLHHLLENSAIIGLRGLDSLSIKTKIQQTLELCISRRTSCVPVSISYFSVVPISDDYKCRRRCIAEHATQEWNQTEEHTANLEKSCAYAKGVEGFVPYKVLGDFSDPSRPLGNGSWEARIVTMEDGKTRRKSKLE